MERGLGNEVGLEEMIGVWKGKVGGEDEWVGVVGVMYDVLKVMVYVGVEVEDGKVMDNEEVMWVEVGEEVCLGWLEMWKVEVVDEDVDGEVE